MKYVELLPRWVSELYCHTTYMWYCTPHSLLFIFTDSNLLAQISYTVSHYLPLYFITYLMYQKMFEIKHFMSNTNVCMIKHDQQNHKYLMEDKAHILVICMYIYIYIYIYLCTQINFTPKLSQYEIWSESIGKFQNQDWCKTARQVGIHDLSITLPLYPLYRDDVFFIPLFIIY